MSNTLHYLIDKIHKAPISIQLNMYHYMKDHNIKGIGLDEYEGFIVDKSHLDILQSCVTKYLEDSDSEYEEVM